MLDVDIFDVQNDVCFSGYQFGQIYCCNPSCNISKYNDNFKVIYSNSHLQLAKLLLPPKYEIIMVPSNCSISNIAIAILDFSLLSLVKLYMQYRKEAMNQSTKLIRATTFAIAKLEKKLVVAIIFSSTVYENIYVQRSKALINHNNLSFSK